MRKSGEPYVVHPLGVARICADLRAETPVIVAALLHDTVEDTDTTLEEIAAEFGDDVALLVDGVTKLSRIHFDSREQAQAENYRKMVLSMARDVRVVIVKLADRLHNMRTLGPLAKQKQIQNAHETLEVFAPIAHRLGIHQIKWELEDLAFATLYPRKYAEIEAMVNERRADREQFVAEAARILDAALREVAHQRRDPRPRQALLLDLREDGAPREGVQRDLRPDRDARPGRLRQGLLRRDRRDPRALEADPGPLQGLRRDAEVERLPVAAHDRDRAPGQAARDPGAHARDAPDRRVRRRGALDLQAPRRASGSSAWLRDVVDSADVGDPEEFMDGLRGGLFDEEVYVFTPKGEVKALPAGATPLDFAYAVHTDVGHRCVGAKVNGRIVPLHSTLGSGDIVEVLTSKAERGPSRDWLGIVRTTRARNKIRQWFAREQREDLEQRGRDALHSPLERPAAPEDHLLAAARRSHPRHGLQEGRRLLRRDRRRQGARQPGRRQILHRLKTNDVAEEQSPATRRHTRARVGSVGELRHRRRRHADPNVLVRMAKCCTPVPGDEITGYISAGRGITIHRVDCPNARALMRSPERFMPVSWNGDAASRSASRSPSTPGTGRACWRTSGGPSPSTAATSSSTAATQDQMARTAT